MDKVLVCGGKRLVGEVSVSGAKNSALPVLFASLLTSETCLVRNVPSLVDVRTCLRLLGQMGVEVEEPVPGTVMLRAAEPLKTEAPYSLVKTMRASFLTLGPMLARSGRARVSTPGGCAIGSRPVNLHLEGLGKMGAAISLHRGYVEACARRLRGSCIHLEVPSVGATENLLMAATLAEGTTVINNAAREPEVVDLAAALRSMGAMIMGDGTREIVVEGRPSLGGMEHSVIPDRIEAGTLVIAAAITGGDVQVTGARPDHLVALLAKLEEAGVKVSAEDGGVRVQGAQSLRAVDVRTQPYPGFATDLQAQFMALMSVAGGQSVITETIFENRFMHVQELVRMGADIKVDGKHAFVRGVPTLSGAPVMATDLRASVCLVLAGLVARNTTEIARVYHLDRGYEKLESKLAVLGAEVRRVRAR